jgi:hypothetical protein
MQFMGMGDAPQIDISQDVQNVQNAQDVQQGQQKSESVSL